MKKLILFALAALLLTGCCLQHEWVEGTCETPRTCSKCGEIEGSAPGHHWVAANCTDPETCTGCNATRGEALGHEFGLWEAISDSAMKGICSVCGAETETEIDREVLGTLAILGKWNVITMQVGGPEEVWQPATEEENSTIWVEFFESGEAACQFGDSYTGTYAYTEYRNDSGSYWYTVSFEGAGSVQFRLDADGQLYWVENLISMGFAKQ